MIVDEIGYLPITPGGANLFFQLVNARYEKGAMILTSNRGFAEWADVFGDPVVATALLDRLLPIPKPGSEPEPEARDSVDGHEGDPALGSLSAEQLLDLAKRGALRLDPANTPTEMLTALIRSANNGNGSTPQSEDDEDLDERWKANLGE